MTRTRALLASLLLAACGGASADPDGAVGPDAYRGDGASTLDAPPPADANRVVTVTVYDETGGVRRAATPVVFHSADGVVQVVKNTDENGETSELVGEGWAVTAVVTPWDAEAPYPRLQTVMGVNGGEHLVFGNAEANLDATLLGTMRVQPPGAPTTPERYVTTSIGCNSAYHDAGDSPASIDVYSNCPSPLDFITVSYETTTNTITHYAYTTRVPFTSGGAVAQPAPWHTNFTTTAMTLSNVPAGLAGASLGSSGIVGGFQHGLDSTSVDLASVTSASAALRTFQTFPTSHLLTLSGYDNMGGRSSIAWFVTTPPATLPVDLTADLLPMVTNEAVSGRTVTFTRSLGTAEADAMLVAMSWYEEPVSGNWEIFAPPGAASLTLPVVPTDLGLTFPGATATFYASVGEVEYSGWDGYPAAVAALGGRYLYGVLGRLTDGIFKTSINDRRG